MTIKPSYKTDYKGTLVDHQIAREIFHGYIKIEPYDNELIQPNSIDIRLGNHFAWHRQSDMVLDPLDKESAEYGAMQETTDSIVLLRHQFRLGTTLERFELPADIFAEVTGKSGLARYGLIVHTTAGLIDAGYRGQITLELLNVGNRPIQLTAGMPIAQMTFTRTDPCQKPYGIKHSSKYQDQIGATHSRYYLNANAAND
jgi:dCTP deaminase